LQKLDMAEHDQIQDPQDDIIASLRIQLQLQEQRETGMVRNYVELLLGRIEGLPPQGQQALIPLAMQNEYQIIESRTAARRAELQLLNHQYETRGVQYEQLQQQHRELSMAVNAFSAGSVPQHSTYNIFHGQLAGNVPPEAVAQGPPHELASHPAPVAAQTESDVSPHDL
jgi:hypothetical protein